MHSLSHRLLFSASMLLSSSSLAQDLTIKAPPQSATIAIINAGIHPVEGEAIDQGAIVFKDGTITHVLPMDAFNTQRASLNIATTIDAAGKHVYPGLISPYTQLGLTEIQAVGATNDLGERSGVSPEVRATVAVNPDSTLLPVTRSNGVLIAGVFPTGGTISGQPGVIRLDGWTTLDLTIDDSIGQVLRWPNVRPITAWWMTRSEEEQLKDIRENLARIEQTFDSAKAYADAKSADPASPTDLRWEAMRAIFSPDRAERAPDRIFIAAQDLDQITSAVTFAVGKGLRPVLIGGRDAHLAAHLLKQHDVPVIVLGTHTMPRRDDAPYDDAFTLPSRLADAGLTIAIANSDDTAHERNLPYAAATAAAHGLSRKLALESITINAAKVLGIDNRYGSLVVGKSATLIVTTADPLEVTSHVTHAFIDGRAIDLSNKQSKLAEKYVERYKQIGQWEAK